MLLNIFHWKNYLKARISPSNVYLSLVESAKVEGCEERVFPQSFEVMDALAGVTLQQL